MVLFMVKTKRLECPYGLKGKLQLMKVSLVWLLLRRTRRRRSDCLLLHFHVTSTMMPRAPSAITPPILRQNWKTLARLALWWNKPLDVDMCPHTIVINSSILSCKLTNLLPMVLIPKLRNCHGDFDTQIAKPSTLVLRSKPRNRHSGFEAKPLTNRCHWFWDQTEKPTLLISATCTMWIAHGITRPPDHLATEYSTCA
jgi:hypothetical protein